MKLRNVRPEVESDYFFVIFPKISEKLFRDTCKELTYKVEGIGDSVVDIILDRLAERFSL